MPDNRLDDVASKQDLIAQANETRKERMIARRDGLALSQKADVNAKNTAQAMAENAERVREARAKSQGKIPSRADALIGHLSPDEIDHIFNPFRLQAEINNALLGLQIGIDDIWNALAMLSEKEEAYKLEPYWGTKSIVYPFHKQYCFGLTKTGQAEFTLWDGYITHGSNAVISVGAITGITITEDNQYIGIEYDTNAGLVTLYGPNTTYPISDGRYYRKAMYKFSYDSGTGTAKVIKTGGGVIGGGQPIDIPSRFGDQI